MEAEECGCQIITVQNSILAKSKNYGKDLEEYSLETVRGFFKDASGLGFPFFDKGSYSMIENYLMNKQ